MVIALFIIFWIVKKNNIKIKSLFGGSEYVDVIPKKQEAANKSILIADIEAIIKSSENLDKVISSSKDGGRLYEKILLDKDLVSQIRGTKNNKEVESLLANWLEKKWSQKSQQSEVHQSQDSNVKTPSKKPPAQQETTKSEKKSTQQKNKQQVIHEKTLDQESSENKPANWAGKSKEVYDEIKNLLESKNIEKLVDIIKNLSDHQIEEILKHYFENFESNKFGVILQRSKSPRDVTNLLKSETIKGLEWEYDRIKENVSIARRKGIDTKSEELKLLSIPHKIKMFQATFEKKDFYKVRDLLIEIENSLRSKEKPEAEKKN